MRGQKKPSPHLLYLAAILLLNAPLALSSPILVPNINTDPVTPPPGRDRTNLSQMTQLPNMPPAGYQPPTNAYSFIPKDPCPSSLSDSEEGLKEDTIKSAGGRMPNTSLGSLEQVNDCTKSLAGVTEVSPVPRQEAGKAPSQTQSEEKRVE